MENINKNKEFANDQFTKYLSDEFMEVVPDGVAILILSQDNDSIKLVHSIDPKVGHNPRVLYIAYGLRHMLANSDLPNRAIDVAVKDLNAQIQEIKENEENQDTEKESESAK